MTCGHGSQGTSRAGPGSPGLAALRPRPGDVACDATRIALRELGRRAQFLDGPSSSAWTSSAPGPRLLTARAPGLLAILRSRPAHRGAAAHRGRRSPGTAAQRGGLGSTPLPRSAPIPASSWEATRHRLNPGGDRQANHALWRIVFTRLGSYLATRANAERRTAEGKSKAEIIRCLKRYVAREVYRQWLRLAAG